jgi:hypothetical protein
MVSLAVTGQQHGLVPKSLSFITGLQAIFPDNCCDTADCIWSGAQHADSDEVARAFRDDVARYSDITSPGVRRLAGG